MGRSRILLNSRRSKRGSVCVSSTDARIPRWGHSVRKLCQGSLVRTASILSALLIASCASQERGYDVQTAAPKPDMSLGPGDTFEVTVYDEKELSGRYQVADDGNINFPLIGAVEVAGKTPNSVAV